MRFLLDIHAFLWWDAEAERLPDTLLETLQDPAHELVLSVVSVWEMQIKTAMRYHLTLVRMAKINKPGNDRYW